MNEIAVTESSVLYDEVHTTLDLLEAQFRPRVVAERATQEDVFEEAPDGSTKHTIRTSVERRYA